MHAAVVTDSTAYLPPGVAERHGITVVPLHLSVDDEPHLDGVDFDADQLAAALTQGRHGVRRRPTITTSRCTPTELREAYLSAARGTSAGGTDGVLALHLSQHLSGTWEAARLASEQLGAEHPDVEVRVVDSRSAAMGLGFPVLAAARATAAGKSLGEAYAAAVDVASRCRTLLCVDTLEHLRRGGRIGTAAALLGTALSMKPLLHVVDGRIQVLEKVRTSSRALARLADIAVEAAGDEPTAVAVHHLGAADRAATLVEQLKQRIPHLTEVYESQVGAVVGAHLGPGMVGVVVCPGGAGDPEQ
ncbi:DegV family protein [Rhodococcus sp. X156]|uniref:DegV family protein n=1 Tax=Rhodococcus sp. X156 TaxID=2499145 RepID=UPI000FD7DA6B|nr:DegV family protein [Rhodococcus sp. X156]